MIDRVHRAIVGAERRRRETLRQAEAILAFLARWAETGETFVLDLSGVAADAEIPEGSLARFLKEPEKCNALAKVSKSPGELLSLMVAYQMVPESGPAL